MLDSPAENNKRVWDYKMADLVKIKRVLRNNLHNLFTMFLAIYITYVKKQIKAIKTSRYG